MNDNEVVIRFFVDGRMTEQVITEIAAWNLMMDLHEVFGLPTHGQIAGQVAPLKILLAD